jgi:hypothetical protein
MVIVSIVEVGAILDGEGLNCELKLKGVINLCFIHSTIKDSGKYGIACFARN